MKTVFNVVLALFALALVYICYASIMGPIEFEEAKSVRDKAVIARLMDIRKAQVEYRNQHNQQYTDNFDTLIHFIKYDSLPIVFKQGELDDKQLEDGLTEKKAIAIVEKAQKTGNYAEVDKWGLRNFQRRTIWVSVKDTVFGRNFNADSLRYIPFGRNGEQFEMAIKNDTAKSGAPFCLLEVKAPYDVYLNGLDAQEIANLKDTNKKLSESGMPRYDGLKIGSLESANNNAGNWE